MGHERHIGIDYGDPRPGRTLLARLDKPLLLAVLALSMLGLIMVASASMPLADQNFGDPLRFFRRQMLYALLGLALAAVVLRTPLARIQQLSTVFMAGAFFLLCVVLVPGIGKEVNGSARWLDLILIRVRSRSRPGWACSSTWPTFSCAASSRCGTVCWAWPRSVYC